MENVTVYSPVEDKQIKTNINQSPIWEKAYTEEEYQKSAKKHNTWFKYSLKFEGVVPIQVTKIQKFTSK